MTRSNFVTNNPGILHAAEILLKMLTFSRRTFSLWCERENETPLSSRWQEGSEYDHGNRLSELSEMTEPRHWCWAGGWGRRWKGISLEVDLRPGARLAGAVNQQEQTVSFSSWVRNFYSKPALYQLVAFLLIAAGRWRCWCAWKCG